MSTFSFADITMTISHASVGQHVMSGEGIGNINTTMATERTAHDTSADGTVMVSKIKGNSGSHSLAVQQTSSLNQWLLKLYKYLVTAPANEWAGISIIIRSPNLQEQITSNGVSFQKLPDKPYQAQGQQITWNFMAADVQQDVI